MNTSIIKLYLKFSSGFLAFISLNACQNNSVGSYEKGDAFTQLDSLKIELDTVKSIENSCLPFPSDEFFAIKQGDPFSFLIEYSLGDFVYLYLIVDSDSLGKRKITKVDESGEFIEWTQQFKNDLTYISIRYPEFGFGGKLITKCTDKKEFINKIAAIIDPGKYDPELFGLNLVWRADSTKFEPDDLGGGCYYRIKKDKNSFYFLEWDCAC
jgi:hypothetical protein